MKQAKQQETVTQAQIDKLLHFLALFDVPGRTFIENWGGGKETGDGAITMLYPIYPDDVLDFYHLAGQPCWADYDYDPWETGQMLADEAFIEQATLAQIKTMLTYCVRGERFCDGHWAAMLESGKIVALLKRLRVLREQASAPEP